MYSDYGRVFLIDLVPLIFLLSKPQYLVGCRKNTLLSEGIRETGVLDADGGLTFGGMRWGIV